MQEPEDAGLCNIEAITLIRLEPIMLLKLPIMLLSPFFSPIMLLLCSISH